jgi:hypothetical protein
LSEIYHPLLLDPLVGASELAQGERELQDTLEKGLILLFEALLQTLASKVSCIGAVHACKHAAAEEVVLV